MPQKVTAELNFIMTKITKILDKKAGANEIKKARYYQAVDAYILNRANKTTSKKDKRIFEYLHTRLVTLSKGLLSQKTPTIITQPIPSESPKVQTVVTLPLGPMISVTPQIEFTSLGINF